MRQLLNILLIGPLLLPAAGVAQGPIEQDAKRAFEIADYFATAFVGAPSMAADGSRVVFTVTRQQLDQGERWSEIWMMGADGSDPRQMTFGRHHDTDPILSPSGSRLLFVSDRGRAEGQLWVMPVDGGEARQLTDFPLELSDPVFSPDGRWIATTAKVYPECGADAECNRTTRDRWEEGPLDAHLADRLLYRHWTSWRDGRYSHVLLVDAHTGDVVRDLTPGLWDSPTFSVRGKRGYVFSPDGEELCFVSNHDPDPASSTNADLWVVPVQPGPAGAQPRNLTGDNKGWDGMPLYSPDGESIAFLSQEAPGYESDLYRLSVVDVSDGAVRRVTTRSTFDDWIDDMAWIPDGETLVFQAQREGRTPLYRVPVAGGEPEHLLTDATVRGWELTLDGAAVVYTRSAVGAPPEVYRAGLDGSGARRLTRFNETLVEQVDIRPAEELWLPGDGDYDVHTFVVKPHGFDPEKTYPLILNVHGGPQQMWADSYRGDWQVYPGEGYVVAFPNPTGSPGYGQEYVEAISCDWGGRVYRDLMRVTDALADLPYVDSKRMGAMGWSYGGYMMMWFEGHTDRFQALAAMMGVYDLRAMYSSTEELWFPEHDLCGAPWTSDHYERWSPSEHVSEFSTPCLVITGEKDFRVPYTQSLEFFTDLRKRNVPARLAVLPGSGHWPSWYEMAFYYLLHVDWFHRHLGGGEPPWDVESFLRNGVFHTERDKE